MDKVIILGAGMAGFGAAHRLKQEGMGSITVERNSYYGRHSASFHHEGGWIFDDGPHISFTRVARMQKLFAESVNYECEKLQARVNNYWKGYWVKHPAQCNLHGLPEDLVVKIIAEFARLGDVDPNSIGNYAEWLEAGYGKTFARTFPMQYGCKYHTTTADNMTTEWCGERLYRPSLEEVLHGALSANTPDLHYIDHFRYPTHGGFASYFNLFLQDTDLRLEHELIRLDARDKNLYFKNGFTVAYDALISSIPLPSLIRLIPDAPADVREAASRLACTTVVIVNLGVNRDHISLPTGPISTTTISSSRGSAFPICSAQIPFLRDAAAYRQRSISPRSTSRCRARRLITSRARLMM